MSEKGIDLFGYNSKAQYTHYRRAKSGPGPTPTRLNLYQIQPLYQFRTSPPPSPESVGPKWCVVTIPVLVDS